MFLIRILMQTVALALGQIRANFARAMLTSLGIIIGVGSVTAVIAGLTGMKSYVLSEFETFGAKKVFIQGWVPPELRTRMDWSQARLTLDEIEAIREHSPSIAKITPIWFSRYEVRNGEYAVTAATVQGIWPEWHDIEARSVTYGRPFNAVDERDRRYVVLVNDKAIEELNLDRDPTGDFVLINGRRFLIIGVVETKDVGAMFGGNDSQAEFFIPFATAAKMQPFGMISYSSPNSSGPTRPTTRGPRSPSCSARCGPHARDAQHLPRRGHAAVHRPVQRARRRHHRDRGRGGQHLAARGRRGHHEHHARLRQRTHPRDRLRRPSAPSPASSSCSSSSRRWCSASPAASWASRWQGLTLAAPEHPNTQLQDARIPEWAVALAFLSAPRSASSSACSRPSRPHDSTPSRPSGMNDPLRSRTLSRCRCALGLPAAALAILAGCSRSPFATYDDELGPRVSLSRLRNVERLDPSRFEAPPERQNPQITRGAPLPDPFANRERIGVTLESARAWTLANNFSLEAILLEPSIANQRVTREEGRFDAIIFANATLSSTEQPTSTQLEGSEVDRFALTPGVRIPLRTGGQITFDAPLSRIDTNNQFSTLNPAYDADGRFSISQPLLRNAGRRVNTHAIRVASISQQISESRTKLEVIRQLADTDRSYWRLYAAQQALEVRILEFELAREQLETARRRADAGDLPEVEVTRAESGVASTLDRIIAAEHHQGTRARTQAHHERPGLDIAARPTWCPRRCPIRSATTSTTRCSPNSPSPNAWNSSNSNSNSRSTSTIAFNKNATLPLFTLDYSVVTNGLGGTWSSAAGQARRTDFIDSFLQARFEAPLGNRQATSTLRESVLQRVQRLSTREARRQAIREETLNAADRVDASWQRIIAARLAVITATRTLDAERRQFDVGLRTSTDVLDASTRLGDARLIEIQALTDYQISLVDLSFATGTTLGAARVEWTPSDPLDAPAPDFRDPPQDPALFGLHVPLPSRGEPAASR